MGYATFGPGTITIGFFKRNACYSQSKISSCTFQQLGNSIFTRMNYAIQAGRAILTGFSTLPQKPHYATFSQGGP